MASPRKVDTRYTVSHLLWSSCCQVVSSAGAQGITIPLSQAQVTNWKLAGAVAPDTCQAAAISRHGYGLHVGDLSSGLGAVALLH